MFERDRGVCTLCGVDTKEQESKIILHCQEYAEKFFQVPKRKLRFIRLVSLWEADHKTPKYQGGDNSLDNLQTLCLKCHKEKTKFDLHF